MIGGDDPLKKLAERCGAHVSAHAPHPWASVLPSANKWLAGDVEFGDARVILVDWDVVFTGDPWVLRALPVDRFAARPAPMQRLSPDLQALVGERFNLPFALEVAPLSLASQFVVGADLAAFRPDGFLRRFRYFNSGVLAIPAGQLHTTLREWSQAWQSLGQLRGDAVRLCGEDAVAANFDRSDQLALAIALARQSVFPLDATHNFLMLDCLVGSCGADAAILHLPTSHDDVLDRGNATPGIVLDIFDQVAAHAAQVAGSASALFHPERLRAELLGLVRAYDLAGPILSPDSDLPAAPPLRIANTELGFEDVQVRPPLTTHIHALHLPLADDPQRGWKRHPVLAGTSPVLDHLGIHASVLSPGVLAHFPHTHTEEELLIVLDGCVECIVGADGEPGAAVHALGQGAMVYYPGGFTHTIRNPGGEPATYLMLKWRCADAAKPTQDPLLPSLVLQPGSFIGQRHNPTFTAGIVLEGSTAYLDRLHVHVTDMQVGGGYAPHADAHDVAILVLSGRVETLGREVRRNGIVFYAAGQDHGLRALGDDAARYLVVEFHRAGAEAERQGPARETPMGRIRRAWHRRRDLSLLRHSGVFDAAWYRASYPDVAQAGADPARHYLLHGADEGRAPGPGFDGVAYGARYPDVRAAGMNPVLHYVRHGRAEGRHAGPLIPAPLAAGQVASTGTRAPHSITTLEIHAWHGCNLKCKSCAHFSPYSRQNGPTLDEAKAWMLAWRDRLSPENFHILGGEPTLNPVLPDIIRIAGANWPESHIQVTTNGLLLHRQPDLPVALAEVGGRLVISLHHDDPSYGTALAPALALLEDWRARYGIQVEILDATRRWTRRYTEPGRVPTPFQSNPQRAWSACIAKACHQLLDFKIWKCAPTAYFQTIRDNVEVSPDWAGYLRSYRPLAPDASEDAVAAFFRMEAEEVCGMCPEILAACEA